MPTQRSTTKRRLAIACLLCVLASFCTTSASAQQAETLTLDAVLERLEDNLHHYDSQIPSFLCDEHVESQVVPGTANQDTVTESTFRLKRDLKADHSTILNESRDVKTVNGRPATADELHGPSILSGAFSGGLAIVSLSQKACMSYKLKPIKTNRPNDLYAVEFATLPSRERPDYCLLQEDGKGRVFIDPATMQITRMELTAPNHVISSGNAAGQKSTSVIGPWVISVDYAPIQLGGQTFWMPTTITSTMTHDQGVSVTLNSGRNRTSSIEGVNSTVWSFAASYSNYHKLEVTSRIVPTTDPPEP
jgi:hypothetical protein